MINPDNLRLEILKQVEQKNASKLIALDGYTKILDLLDEWVDIPEEHKKIIAIWIIGTYFHKSFDTYPYIFLNAMRGSGKTRLLRLISWLQYNGNGELLTNPSDAVMFRTAQERGIILDEFESEKSKDKQTMREYLNACYKRGGMVYRMEKQKIDGKEKQVAVGYPLYTPVAMANINGVEDVLGDRSITLIIEKSMNMALVKKIEDFYRNQFIQEIKTNFSKFSVELCSVYLPQKAIDQWNVYINRRYYTTLHTPHTLHNSTSLHSEEKKENDTFLSLFEKIDSTGIFGRNLELFFPLLIVADMIGGSTFDEIIKIISGLNKNKKEDEFAESKDVSLIEFVANEEKYRFEQAYTSDLFREFKEFIGNQGGDEESRWLNLTWFGLALKRLKLISDRKRVAKGQMVLLNVDNAKEKIKIFKDVAK